MRFYQVVFYQVGFFVFCFCFGFFCCFLSIEVIAVTSEADLLVDKHGLNARCVFLSVQ